MLSHRFFPSQEEGGQGLTEYAFILTLVAVVVMMAMAFFGQGLMNAYCQITLEFSVIADLSGPCDSPMVSPVINAQGPNTINIEAVILDPDADPADPYGAIDRVEFYIDDANGSPVQTEYHYRYCISGNPSSQPCGNYSTSGLSSGGHTAIILAYDDDGNVGRSEIDFTI